MFVYYHVSVIGNLNEKEFIPRIPERALDNEEKETPRVCVSQTLEGAIKAFPDGYKFSTINNIMSTFLYVFEIDACKIGCNNVRYWDQIIKYVPDACKTKEAWITKKFNCTAKIYRFENGVHETKPTISKEYTDCIIGEENFKTLSEKYNLEYVGYENNYGGCYSVKYIADENTQELWEAIAKTHEVIYDQSEKCLV